GVDLGEEGGGRGDPPDAAVVDGGREPGGVGDDAAPHGHDHVASGEPPPGELAAEVLDGLEVLGRLALAHGEHPLVDARVDLNAHALLGDDGGARGAEGHHLEEPVARPPADEDVVGAVTEGDGHGYHGIASTMRSTT